MIDAIQFAKSYNAFWRECAPTCERYIRRVNLDGQDRFDVPLPRVVSNERSQIAEFAFSLFVENLIDRSAPESSRTENDREVEAWRKTELRLKLYQSKGLVIRKNLLDEELWEVRQIARRLIHFFGRRQQPLFLRPMFRGCGFIDKSEGDVISQKTLFEVKSVDRPIRGIDIRQVITYGALNFFSKEYEVTKLGIINPISGLYLEVNVEELSWEIAGITASELFNHIGSAIFSGGISR